MGTRSPTLLDATRKMSRQRPVAVAAAALVCLAAGASSAQTPSRTMGPAVEGVPGIRVYGDKDGVPASVATTAFDSTGRLWIGTENGPVRYDGNSWTRISLASQPGSAWVTALAAGDDDEMWVGLRAGGLWRVGPGESSHVDAQSGLPSNSVLALARGASAEKRPVLWVGTDRGAARLHDGSWTSFQAKSSPLPGDLVTAIVASPDRDAAWIGTRTGLARWLDGRWTVYRAGSSPLPDDEVTALMETPGAGGGMELWVGTRRAGVVHVVGDTWTVLDQEHGGLPNNYVFSLEQTTSGDRSTTWIGTYGSGLVRWEDGVTATFDTQSSAIPGNYISALRRTPDALGGNSLWVGIAGGGLARIRLGGWQAFTPRSHALPAGVWSFLETQEADHETALWIGTMGGVHRFARGAWTPFQTSNSPLPHDFVLALLQSASPEHPGAILAGTQAGIAMFEHNQWSLLATMANGLPSDGVRCMLESRQSNGRVALWVGTAVGLARYEDGAWTRFDKDNSGLASNAILSLLETRSPDDESTLWVGTTGGGLSRYRNHGWTTFRAADSPLPSDEVLALAQVVAPDGARTIWVGAGSGGVVRFDPAAPDHPWSTVFDKASPPVPNDTVYDVVQDAQRRVYLLTNHGVVRLTPRPASQDSGVAYDSIAYTVDDGLPASEGNARAAFVDHRGRIWVGTVGGAAVFDPARDQPAPTSLPLQLQGRSANAPGSPLVGGAELPWNDTTVVFDYALLSLFRESDTRYRTQLVGFDAAPSEWSADAKSRYTNLPAGVYEFKVWGRDYAGQASGPASMAFRVATAPWRTAWAFTGYAALLLGTGYGASRLRTRALRRRTLALEHNVRERTAQLHATNTELDGKNAELAENVRRLEAARRDMEEKNAELARLNEDLLESNHRADRIFSALAEALPGTVLDGRYKLEKRIGAGGFAIVFRALHLSLGRAVAVKVFRPVSGNDSASALERFRREAISACRVDHPNAIQIFDSGISEDGIAYMAMELLEGQTVGAAMRSLRVLSVRRCAEIVMPVCSALAKAHEAGVIHRDIKPANIFLHNGPDGEVVKLVDFGIAKALGAVDHLDATLTNTNHLLGTPLYMAPERFRGRECDARSDVYSVGVLMYRMLSARWPYEGDVMQLLASMQTDRPVSLRHAAPFVPQELSDLVMRMLSLKVAERPTAAEVAESLQRFVVADSPETRGPRDGSSDPYLHDEPTVEDSTGAARRKGLA